MTHYADKKINQEKSSKQGYVSRDPRFCLRSHHTLGVPENHPFFDLEMRANLLDIFNQMPGGVFLQTRRRGRLACSATGPIDLELS
jgi:hypothetical protein